MSKKAYEPTVWRHCQDPTGICPKASPPGHLGSFSSTLGPQEKGSRASLMKWALSMLSWSFQSTPLPLIVEQLPRVISSSGSCQTLSHSPVLTPPCATNQSGVRVDPSALALGAAMGHGARHP